ncbi:hypothetical protein BABINDRAFT_29657 [Babjeviella inositovora NRRL Y-12698]|uniref:Major facilitator superfamily (MFS) profile domain-containing protein n=1 Tax=Babjeviella inositovora NRRL Y-12698 TaxID=984486 RepID=A0A1E3QYC4_9ASCO|nr:uncharacterized protein BABINDRAFT_29657 [Babjeviella inositovora NRRL Y-12698]ODQ82679.1 hypothetical protein BABINDRAFT_29657 [Babjeviella inositovora NRRL Y-12698]
MNAPTNVYASDRFLVGKALLYFTSIFVSLGVFIFGFDQGLMSGLITNHYFQAYFHNPSAAEIGTMVAILEIGALLSSLLVGWIGDHIGRKRTIRYGAFIFIIGGAFQTGSRNIIELSAGRFISGLGIGLLSAIVPVYQSEISPPDNRGQLACMEFTGNIIGYSSSIWLDYICSYMESHKSWRVPLGVQVVMGSILFLGSFALVETPRWLLDNDHDTEGIMVIADLYSSGDIHHPKAQTEFTAIKESVLISRLEGERSYAFMFKRYKKRVVIAMASQMFAQLNGINIISYYAPLVFEQAGWVGRDAILMTGLNSIIYVLSTLPPWYLVDAWGRRKLLLYGAIAMGIPLLSIAYVLYLNIPLTPLLVVILVVIYNAAFGCSWGPLPWLYPPEILPLSIRSKGTSLSTASNWIFNWLVGEMTPILQESIRWKMYLIPAASCFLSLGVVYVMFPETKGLQLEDMDSAFDDSSSIFSFHSSHHSARDTPNDATLTSGRPGAPRMESNSQLGENSRGITSLRDVVTPDGGPQVQPPTLDEILAYKAKQKQGGTSIRSFLSGSHRQKGTGESESLLG